MTENEKDSNQGNSSSYNQILKSSSIMGGVAVITLLLGMIRTKFAALYIGTLGVGLLNNFNVILGFVAVIAGLGIQSSGVRQISIAFANKEEIVLAKTVLVLKRISWVSGILGAILIFLLSSTISKITFGSDEYHWEVAALGLIIIFMNISGGLSAIIQGTRNLKDLAKVQIYSSIGGTLVTTIFYLTIGLKGIIPGLVLFSLIQLLTSWKLSQSISLPKIEMSWKESFAKVNQLVKFGVAMMWSSLMVSLVAYLANVIITNKINIESVGIYSAAFALSGMFVNFVLNAMGTDFYPRLSSLVDNEHSMNKLVNEQTEIAILLAIPGLIGTIVLAPWVVPLFYSNEFSLAAELIPWLVLGCFGRVISWPMGFILLAKGKSKSFFITETIANLIHLIFVYGLATWIGVKGVSIAFVLCYVFYTPLIYYVANRVNKFNWSNVTKKYILISLFVLLVEILISFHVEKKISLLINILIIFPAFIIFIKELISKLGHSHKVTKLLLKLPFVKFKFQNN